MKRMKIRPALSYTRVSTKDQGDNGIGLEGQMHAIKACADILGYRIEESFTDVASGAGDVTLNGRPGLSQAIAVAQAKGIPIIVAGLDRLARSTRTTEHIILTQKVEVISATEGRMENPVTISSRAARAQHERDMISRRTRESLAAKKRQGVLLGNRKNLAEAQKKGAARNKERAEAKVQEIADVLVTIPGWESMIAADVVAALNARSIKTGRGGAWSLGSIRRPLEAVRKLVQERETRARVQQQAKISNNPNFGRF